MVLFSLDCCGRVLALELVLEGVVGWDNRADDEVPCDDSGPPSSEKILPIDERGLCIVRRRPATAAFSSPVSLDPSFPSRDESDRRGVDHSTSTEFRGVTSGRLSEDFSDTCTWFGVGGVGSTCLSAIEDTAASTFFSKSSSEMLRLVRSRFSMNVTAPNLDTSDNFECGEDQSNSPGRTGSSRLHHLASLDSEIAEYTARSRRDAQDLPGERRR